MFRGGFCPNARDQLIKPVITKWRLKIRGFSAHTNKRQVQIKMKKQTANMLPLLAIGAAVGLSSCATSTVGRIDDKTDAVLTAMSDKLAAAKTLRVTATRTSSPGFHPGIDAAESASGTVVVQRPDKLAAQIKSNRGRRSVGFDGHHLTIVDYAAGTHSVVKAVGDIDTTVSAIQAIYGVTPPIAELLVNHPKKHLLDGVQSAKYTGLETVNGVECDRLTFQQERLTWRLWVATGDKLPRRIAFAYPNGEGGAPLTVNATITKWELDPLVPTTGLTVGPPAKSRAVEMIPLSN